MTDFWIIPDRVFDGHALHEDLGVCLRDGHIAEIGAAPEGSVRVSGTITPGFVDLQVNGGGGVQLNTTPTAEGMQQIAAAHRQFGTVALMPTVITDAPDVMDRAADAAIAAKGADGVIGLHIEGPHISVPRRGTHDSQFIRHCDDRTLAVVQRLRAAHVPVMITLAPEAASLDQIAALSQMGAVVSVGHTDATTEAVEAAIAAGASCATHLFNAMSPMTSRAPGTVGAVMDSEIAAGIICDGYHVDDRMVRLALRGRPRADRLFLVSDAMATVGGPDQFDLYGQTVTLKDGRLINAEGSLAGAHTTQAIGVKRLVENIGADLTRALEMAVTNPAAAIGVPALASLVARKAQDVILLSDTLDVVCDLAALHSNPAAMNAAE